MTNVQAEETLHDLTKRTYREIRDIHGGVKWKKLTDEDVQWYRGLVAAVLHAVVDLALENLDDPGEQLRIIDITDSLEEVAAQA